MSSSPQSEFTLEGLEAILARIQLNSVDNVARLEQAVEAMRSGGVGDSILSIYEEIQEGVVAVRDVAHGADSELSLQHGVRDAYASVPDAGDKKFLTDE